METLEGVKIRGWPAEPGTGRGSSGKEKEQKLCNQTELLLPSLGVLNKSVAYVNWEKWCTSQRMVVFHGAKFFTEPITGPDILANMSKQRGKG